MDHLLSKENASLKIWSDIKITKEELKWVIELILFSLEELFPQIKIDFWKLDNKKINMFFLNRIARKKKISSETLEIQEEKPKNKKL